MRILLVIPGLGAGGAERVMATLANRWAEAGWEVTLLTLGAGEDFFALHPAVERLSLGLLQPSQGPVAALLGNLRRCLALRQALRAATPDVVVSFMERTNALTLAATLGLRLPVVISERSNPLRTVPPRFWRLLRRGLYPHCASLVVQTEAVRNWALNLLPQQRIRVIPNALSAEALHDSEPPGCLVPERTVVAMGRLTEVKGFDLLLQAFARCSAECADWHLLILGDGELREQLTHQADDLGLAGRVHLPGNVKQPAAVLRRCRIFVLTSHYEGFPNALLEAMSCGLPAVSFDCPVGPSEIIRDGIDGRLVPAGDVAALTAAMKELMTDESLRLGMGKRAVEVCVRYAPERILPLWDRLLESVAGAEGRADL